MQATLGVDIAKAKFDVCLKVDGKQKSKVFNNTQEGFEACLSWKKTMGHPLFGCVWKQPGGSGEALSPDFSNFQIR